MEYCQKCSINTPAQGHIICSECYAKEEFLEDKLQKELFEEYVVDHPDYLIAQQQLAERSKENDYKLPF